MSQQQISIVEILPNTFDQGDWDPCPDCSGTGITRDRDGSVTGTQGALVVCVCMTSSLDKWAITWIENVINHLFQRSTMVDRQAA